MPKQIACEPIELSEVADLVSAVAEVLWPILGLVALLLFRNDISSLVRRLRKGKFVGQELELGEDVRALEQSTEQAAQQLPPAPVANTELRPEPDRAREVLSQAALSPHLALVGLGIELERELVSLASVLGYFEDAQPPTPRRLMDVLIKRRVLPAEYGRAIELFSRVRNRIAHAQVTEDGEVAVAMESGLSLLRTIKGTARQAYAVAHANVPIFSDSQCTQSVPGATAVVLQIYSKDGAKAQMAAYPTTRTDYRAGMRIGWEWNMDQVFGESWYVDPDTKERRYGWTSSAEFVGRPLQG